MSDASASTSRKSGPKRHMQLAWIGLIVGAVNAWGCVGQDDLLVPPGTGETAASAEGTTGVTSSALSLPAAPSELSVALAPEGFRIPVDFVSECEYLRALDAPPADLTMEDFIGCLQDESRQFIEAAYAQRYARSREMPRSLDAFIETYGETPVRDGSIREVLEGPSVPVAVTLEGIEPIVPKGGATSGPYGLDPSTCATSCLSRSYPVVNGWRTVGWRAAFSGPGNNPGGARQLDSIDYGQFPDFDQDDLSNGELRDAGCGPVSAVNLFEWWGIPVWQGSTHHTTFDARANYIADRMDTLLGVNFTDDEELIDFLMDYPQELYAAGRISGYPGAHYRLGDPSAFKAMINYISEGNPVIALYSTGEESLHWAMIAGYTDGKLRIANGNDRTLADFYNQWDDWEALAWYAEWASELWVEKDTFIAYTGWSSSTGIVQPDRFVSRSSTSSTPSYTRGGARYGFRYCLPGNDEIGNQAESRHFVDWPSEPSASSPGYCILNASRGYPTLTRVPNSGVLVSPGWSVDLSVQNNSSLQNFIWNNPGARCSWYGRNANGAFTHLSTRRCGEAGALSYTLNYSGTNTNFTSIRFFVHSPEFLQTNWDLYPLILVFFPIWF